MNKLLVFFSFVYLSSNIFGQQLPVNCDLAVPGCSTPSFDIVGTQPPYNTVDFTSGSISNPSSNPNPGNAGCLLSGETVSTFITINVVSNGTLQWSMIGNQGGCFDWIMWPNNNNNGCAGINGNTLPPVACNWNGSCNGNTGMAAPGSLPPGGSPSSYENPLNVTAGQSFILCLSNFSFTNQTVNLSFFGSAQVVCGVSAPDQTICLGASASVTIATPGYTNPSFQWLVTNGVSNTTSGSNVTVNPTVTTTYSVQVSQPAMGNNPALVDTATFTITVVPPPTPNAGPDQTVCFGTPFTLSGNVPVAPTTAVWNVVSPSGMTPPASASMTPNFSSANPTVTVTQPGTYQFIWKQTSTTCGIVRDTVVVNVIEQTITATPTSPSCGGYADGSITINAPNATEYSFDGGTTWGTNATQGGLIAGQYNVCARNALGCQKCMNVTITEPVPVVMTLSNDTLICQNGTATLTATATGGASYNFIWGHTANTNGTQQVSPSIDDYYSVVAVNQSGCLSQPDSILVTIRPALSGSLTPLDQYVCPGYPGTIATANIAGGIGQPYSFNWSTGYASNGTTSSITDSPQVATTYSVTISDGCETTPLVLSTQILTHIVPIPQIFVDEPIQCEPAVFNVTNVTNNVPVAGSIWNVSNGDDYVNQTTITSDELYAGLFDVQLIVVSADGCIDSTTFVGALNVRPQPVADFKWSPDPVTMFNTFVTFTNYSIGADSYQWTFDGGNPFSSTEVNTQVMFPDGLTGYYDVTLIATSDLGCDDTITKTVPVMPEVLIYAPNAFTPDGDEFNQSWLVYMEGIDKFDVELLIYNRWGEIIWESHDLEQPWDGTYHGEIVPQGQYTWTIRTKDALNDKKYEFKGSVNVIR